MASSLWTKGLRPGICCQSRRSLATLSLRPNVIPNRVAPSSRRWEAHHSIKEALDQTITDFNPDSGAAATPMDLSDSAPADEAQSFSSLKGRIDYDTLKAITVKPFKLTTMTSVQSAVLGMLPDLVEPYDPAGPPKGPRDLLVRAKTGTGKTLAFLVPAIEARLKMIKFAAKQSVKDAGLESDKHMEGRVRRAFTRTEVGTLVISPTRELATQIANETLRLSHHHDDFEVRLFVGGTSKRQQMRDWMKGRRDIVVATPGRLRDLLESEPDVLRGICKTRMLILDECDTLLDMGFRDDLEAIVKYLPPAPERQTFLFSATVSRAVHQVARATLSKNHQFINTVTEEDSPVHAHVPQYHTILPNAGQQIPHVLRLLAHDQLNHPGKSKAIIFLPTTKMTQLFATFLRELSKTCLPSGKNSKVYEIHSKRTQEGRTAASDQFRADKSGASILVTSDVSARGVDYPGVTRVIQVGIPGSTDQYIHRIGRTGRGGSTEGRGDLVLLPWEVGFVTWQLTDVPLKPVTTNELKEEVKALAEKFDTDPKAAFEGIQTVKFDGRGKSVAGLPQVYQAPYSTILDRIEETTTNLLQKVDEDAIKETLASLLGYYIAKCPELRIQKPILLQGCRDWSTGACGLPHPPYISNTFLDKLGFQDNRTKHFGKSRRVEEVTRVARNSWEGRGSTKAKARRGLEPPRYRDQGELDPDDPRGAPEEYRSTRYKPTRF